VLQERATWANVQEVASRLRWTHVLPLLHILVCLVIAGARIESGWEFLMVADLPASALFLSIIYNFDHPLILFGIFGTLWWYLLSRVVEIVVVKPIIAARRKRGAGGPRSGEHD
jgi:hypothetical protein